jgi:hypothetical protein
MKTAAFKSVKNEKNLVAFAKAWNNPPVSPDRKLDVSPLYRYFAALAAENAMVSDPDIEARPARSSRR